MNLFRQVFGLGKPLPKVYDFHGCGVHDPHNLKDILSAMFNTDEGALIFDVRSMVFDERNTKVRFECAGKFYVLNIGVDHVKPGYRRGT